jgi:hypothetical protein
MKFLTLVVCLFALFSTSIAKDEMPVTELVKKHLESIGTDQARAAVKSRVAQGTLRFHVLTGGAGYQDGKQVFVSEGNKFVSLLKLPNPNYHGERFVCDGRKTEEAQIKPGVWSELGDFLRVHNEILTEGLWGGALSTAWPLANLEDRHATLHDDGIKKVDGRDLHRVTYKPSRSSDLEIQLYFEPETSRHVLTTYSLSISPRMGRTDAATAGAQFTRYHLEERFSDFKESDGLMLPRSWDVRFNFDIPLGTSMVASHASQTEYESAAIDVSNNVTLDPKNFEVK